MARFVYSARDRAGKTVTADIDAPSRRDALRLISARGLQASSVTEIAAGSAKPGANGKSAAKPGKAAATVVETATPTARAKSLKRSECLPFLEALHDLLSSGLSAGEAVRLLSIRIKEPKLRTLCGGLWEQISEGAPLWRAMSSFPQVFDASITNLIQAGEATGSITDTVGRIIAHLQQQRELRREVASALAYPVLMIVMGVGVIAFFLLFLLPRLQGLLTSLGGKIPTSTAILMSVANFAIQYGVFIIVGLIFAAGAFLRWRATEAGRAKTDAWLLKLPMAGQFAVSRTVLSFSQTLSVLLENGITAAEALRMTEKQIDNRVHRAAFNTATARVLEGEALSAALARTQCFPDLVLDRLSVGENTGNVVPSLKQIAIAYQKQITNQLNMLTKVLGSALTIAVFIFVGFIAFAMVSAIFQVSSSFNMR